MNIAVVASLHGTETFGLKVLEDLRKRKLPIVGIVGNPKAIKQKKRYIDYDLNRSFNFEGHGYEHQRARLILGKVKDCEVILDIHNTNTGVKNALIIHELSPLTLSIINLHPGREIVLMPSELAKRSLIGQFEEGAISLEYSRRYSRTKEALREVSEVVELAMAGKSRKPLERTVYLVDRTITLDEAEGLNNSHNHAYIPKLKGYGFLVGENAYKGRHGGFLAKTVNKMVI